MVRGDYQDYRRATVISLIGLLVQAGVALLVLIYSQYSGDHAAVTASILFGSGIIVWFMLLLVFDQHRRERIEALEAEQLASTGGSSASAFADTDDEHRLAARRLAFIHKWIVPLAGFVFAAINIGLGASRLSDWYAFSSAETFTYTTNIVGATLAIGLAIGVVGFVFARFVSGMGKEPAWANLRAGAAQFVAISLVGVLLGVGAFVELALDQLAVKSLIPVIVPIMMIVLGAEIVLNLVLDVYRPRKPGEDPRPAFDSRLLGLLAAPDRIAANIGEALNYQFGVDVTGTWFYQLLSKLLLWLVGTGVALAWILTMLVVVEPHERGLILTNGRVSDPLYSFGERGDRDIGPGLHVKWPWPFSSYETPVSFAMAGNEDAELRTTTGVRVLDLGSNPPDPTETGPILWTESHAARETLSIVQPMSDGSDTENARERVDLSLVVAEIPMQFVVRDVKLFDQFAARGEREQLLRVIGRRVVTRFLGERPLDRVLLKGGTIMPEALKDRLEEAYSTLNNGKGPGIEILFVGIHGVHPPIRVAPSFERVIKARQNRESSTEEARRTEIRTLTEVAGSVELAKKIVGQLEDLERRRREGTSPDELIDAELEVQRLLEQAGGEAGEALLSAGAQRWQRHMGERGKAVLLEGQQLAYEAAPRLYRSKAYFDAWLEAIRDSRVYLTPADLGSLLVRMDLIDRERGADVFDPEAGAELNP